MNKLLLFMPSFAKFIITVISDLIDYHYPYFCSLKLCHKQRFRQKEKQICRIMLHLVNKFFRENGVAWAPSYTLLGSKVLNPFRAKAVYWRLHNSMRSLKIQTLMCTFTKMYLTFWKTMRKKRNLVKNITT